MSIEQIQKLQPDRTLYLRGFTGVGAGAALCHTSFTGFTVCGVFRDMADFCVLNIYDADNTFEHYSLRYLPDFRLSGMTLSFQVAYQGLQPLDSSKYSWIDWSHLDVIRSDGTTSQVRLWDHAQLVGGSYTVASATCQIRTASGGCQANDRLTLFVNNVSFDFLAEGAESAGQVSDFFARAINSYDWSNFDSHSISVLAVSDGTGGLTLKNARAGKVLLQNNKLQWTDGVKFPGIAVGSAIYVGGAQYSVASVDSPTSLTLAQGSGFSTNAALPYLAEYGGVDGNAVSAYFVVRPGNTGLSVEQPVVSLSGGNSDNVTWQITLDFSALGIDEVRQAWLTFAPQLASSTAYSDTEWRAVFTNWTVSDPLGVRVLKCAGPGSVRIGNDEPQSCTYSGSGWQLISANNYWHGFARATANPGDSVTVTYSSTLTHDLYLGTSLCGNRGSVALSLDGQSLSPLNCDLNVTSELVTRRLVAPQVAAGTHSLTITLLDTNQNSWNPSFNPFRFVFDYLEAAVPSDFADAPVVYPNASPALDFDTDATYKVSPQRLLWHLQKLGMRGQLNEYLGVFWWNQRKRASGYNGVNVVWNSAAVTYSGVWTPGEVLTIRIGGASGFSPKKTITDWDTADTIAEHFISYINCASVAIWAEKTGTGQLTIHTRTPNWGDAIDTGDANDPRITLSGNLDIGVDGTWIIDTSAANPISYPVREWHSDLFQAVAAAGLLITTSFSMELVNAPDDGTPGNEWVARYAGGQQVSTDTGFSNLFSSQCAPIPNVTAYQQSAFTVMAGLQQQAGLTPWLQFGEFLWWFFSSISQPVGYCAFTDPISIGVANPHGMKTGDRVVISGVAGCEAANGTWPITVTDSTHFTIPVSANAAWVPGTGSVRGGSMAYYDSVTAAAAQAALGRPLFPFTCQDDDPTVNGGADAAFLASRLKAHVDAIREHVLASYPNAKFEILYPNDVNNPVCYVGPAVPYPQGGRLNAAVNLPPEWRLKSSSGFDRFKVEALSWSASYFNLALADQAIQFACTPPMQWSTADMAYLIPWFNGTCAWQAEYDTARNLVPLVNFWAYDHLALLSWPLPFPTPLRCSFFAG